MTALDILISYASPLIASLSIALAFAIAAGVLVISLGRIDAERDAGFDPKRRALLDPVERD